MDNSLVQLDENMSHACRATQDGWVMVESCDKMWSSEDGNGKPLWRSCLENPMNSMKRQKDRTLKDELPGWQVPNMLLEKRGKTTRKNEEMKPKQKQHPGMNVTGDGLKSDAVKNNIAQEPGMLGP